jgi:hypothetical protein
MVAGRREALIYLIMIRIMVGHLALLALLFESSLNPHTPLTWTGFIPTPPFTQAFC